MGLACRGGYTTSPARDRGKLTQDIIEECRVVSHELKDVFMGDTEEGQEGVACPNLQKQKMSLLLLLLYIF